MQPIYKLLATAAQTEALRQKYLGGNFGYGHAKQELFELIAEKYKEERKTFNYYMENPDELEKKLVQGEVKARIVATQVLNRVREKLGYK